MCVCRSSGDRVYYPGTPLVKGVYNNDPHTLIRFDTEGVEQEEKYALVLSQLNKKRDCSYSISVFCSTCPFRFYPSPGLPLYRVNNSLLPLCRV